MPAAWLGRLLVAGCLAGLCAGLAPAAPPAAPAKPAAQEPPRKEGLAGQLLELTGAPRVKVVWTRGFRDGGGILMCFDTEEGKERVLVPGQKAIDPKLTPDATRVLFTSEGQTSYIVNWDGTGLRQLFKGRHYYIQGCARDEKTDAEWVYVGDCQSAEAQADLKSKGIQASDDSGLSLWRHRLDDLSVKELVWDKMPFNRRTSVSADGSCAFGEIPWPNCGVFTMPNGEFRLFGQGCNGNLAPDGSGMFFHLIGDHRQLKMYDKDGKLKGQFPINTMPGIEKDPERKVWRPLWSTDVRVFAVQSSDLGQDADIAVGRFNDTFTAVAAWVRLTDTTDYDGNALVWIDTPPPLGERLTDNLRLKLLKDVAKRLESAPAAKPAADEIAAAAAGGDAAKAEEAKLVLAHAGRWAAAAREKIRAQEAGDPVGADKAWRAFAARFKGTAWAGEAEERLKDPKLAKQVKGWAQYEKALKAEKAFVEVKGAEAKTTDKVWMMKNQMQVINVKEAARSLKQNYADTLAWTKTQELMARYEISIEPPPKPEPAKKPAEQPKKPK